MDFSRLDAMLRDSAADLKLDDEERESLRQLGDVLDPERAAFMRNRAFAIARELMQQSPDEAMQCLKWLEQVVRTLDQINSPKRIKASAHFSPGEDCRNKLLELMRHSRKMLDICVFTISDDRLSEAVLDCHRRGVEVRVITDSEKRFDGGSDVEWLLRANLPLRVDDSEYHMHHKFAVFDRKILVNGSFNWTLSASRHNEENILVTDNPALVGSYLQLFETLWARYE